ncbi:uncharacterized protein LOC142775574 [Rhipicephalus microplus]|uniref:uncharacterized protein LOC142775574 n=1 Tax=Rhipicephalus microplus TaxID=6941 RepID=UPI003F6A9D68
MTSTTMEVAGLHLMVDLLAEDILAQLTAVLCDSKVAQQTMAHHHHAGLTGSLLATNLRALEASGTSVSFHWLPSHVGIAGHEETYTLAKAAHHPDTPHRLGRGGQGLPAGSHQEACRLGPPGTKGGQWAGTKASPRGRP